MDTIPQSLATPRDGYGAAAPDAGRLGEARNKLAAALWAFSLAQAAVPGLEAALAAGAPLPRDDLFELDRVRSALAEGAQALDLDPDRATLADLEARLASWERAVALRHRLGRMAQATGPAAGGAALAVVAADAARLAGTASWSPDDEVQAMALGRLVELVDVVAGGGEEEHVLALDAELRSNLGPAAAPVVLAAVRGRLVLPDHPVAPFEANGHPPPGSGPPPAGPPPVRARRANGSPSSGSAGGVAASLNAKPARRWWVLAVLGLGQLMVVLDVTIVNIALPSAQQALGFSNANRTFVVTAYTLAFGGLLLLGGRLSDHFGRKRTFLIGMIGFALGSAVAGASIDFVMLVAARAVQGAFAALLAPSALSLLTTTFSDSKDRGKAFGVYGGIASGGAALGLLLGGGLTQTLGWRYTLYINDVFAVVGAIGAVVLLTNAGSSRKVGIDYRGAVTVVAGLVSLVYGFTEAETRGWTDPLTLGLMIGGGLLLAIFVWIETRVDRPLLPMSLVAHRNRLGPYLAVFSVSIGTFGTFLFLTYYLQQNMGYSPLKTGVVFLPMVGALMTTSILSNGVLLRRMGPRPLLAGGLLVAAVGTALLAQLGVHTSYLTTILPGLVIFGAGLGFTFPPAMNTATAGIAETDAGVGSAMVTTSQQIGASVGTALLNTIAASATARYLVSRTPNAQVLAQASVQGDRTVFTVVAAILVVGAVVCGLVVRKKSP
ncbi:MAG: drug resistance transporter, EmrB/QacA subfamily [Actinobacteria bacterium]|nr:drug resistance transporter, EmrB/QacA subfamily [Actinomycetota bacterium]